MKYRSTMVASLVALSLALGGAAARAQGVQTGSLTGTVRSDDGLSLPGATVTVSSPALQGARTAVTDVNGMYLLRGLPPGMYSVSVEFPDMRPFEDTATVPLGGTATVNATMQLAGVAEVITVTGAVPSPIVGTTTATNLTSETIATLPTGRTPSLIAELAPGLTANTPNVGQVTIAGAFAFDNVFMIDGVDTNENLFGTSNNLFIEDAIAETTVLTSGLSAEYGRFSGGVINIITKSGGNIFSGSFRQNLSNPSWTAETPFEREQDRTRESDLSTTWEGTFGGPIALDRAWFFTAGRYEDMTDATTLPETNLPFTATTTNRRFELKGTVTPAPNHTVQASFIDNNTDQFRRTFTFSIDPNVAEERTLPNRLFSAHWNGVLAGNYFATLQVSRKVFGFRDSGGTSTDVVASPYITRTQALGHFNAPYFDAADPEDRNNLQLAGSVGYFLSTTEAGSHDLKLGFDHFTSSRTGGNSQSATGFVFNTDYATGPDGAPLIGPDGRIVPVFVPGISRLENWRAVRGAQIDVRTLSLYLQDRWAVNRHVSLDLGVRYERVRSEATGGIIGADTDRIVPRLGASYDVYGDGRTTLRATFGQYSGKYAENQIGRNTNVGIPDLVLYEYNGPAGQGREFAPALDLNNYSIIGGTFPTANVFLADDLRSPVATEYSLGVGQEIGNRGWVRATFTSRTWSSFIESFIDDPSPAGKVTVIRDGIDFGTFDRVEWRSNDDATRRYRDLQLHSEYQVGPRLHLNGHWTIQLQNEGDFVGEATNQPGIGSVIGDRPESTVRERNSPVGRFDSFQRHKVRLWAIYNQDLGQFGSVDIAPLVRIESGRAYSLSATGVPLSDIQIARDPGYARLPGGGAQTLFFGERGSETFNGYGLLDLSFNYAVPVWRQLGPWVKVEILNVLDNQKMIQWNTTVVPDPDSPLDEHGLPTGFIEGPRFGEATAITHFPRWRPGENGGRTFLMAWGMRF